MGNYQPEHVFALKQALALYDFYQQCIDECDVEIERAVAILNIAHSFPAAPLPKAKHRNKMPSDPNFDVRTAMYSWREPTLRKFTASARSLHCA